MFLGRQNIQYLKRLLPYLKRQRKSWMLAGFLMFLTAGLQLPMPLLTRYFIDHVLPEKNYQLLNWIVLGLLAFMILNLISSFWNRYLLALVKERILRVIQVRLFEHIERLNLSFHNEMRTGYLLSRIANDVSNLHGLLADTLLNFTLDSLTFCVGASVIFLFHWKLALLALAILPFFIYSIHFFSGRIRGKSAEVQERIGEVSSVIAEGLSGIRIIKSFCLEKTQARKLLKKLNMSMRSNIQFTVLTSVSSYVTAFIGGLGPLIVLWYGGREVMSGNLSLGTLVAFNAFLGYMYGPAQRLMNLNNQVQTSLASLGRIFQLFDHVPEGTDTRVTKRLIQAQGRVKFEAVFFSYNGPKPVLSDISFEVGIGEKVALVGKSGVGKTTLVNLLLRFYEPQRGIIYVDDTDIRDLSIDALREQIGIVAQEVFLFSGTVEENIKYARWNASSEEVTTAAQLANAHDFILQLPQGYNTEIGERGVKLSGGQRQRLAIARTILRNPAILILDEATSEVDSESERLIQGALSKLLKNRTALIIAHRLSTVRKADRIIVIEDGKIIGNGSHRELYSRCHLYRYLYDLQFQV